MHRCQEGDRSIDGVSEGRATCPGQNEVGRRGIKVSIVQ